MTLTGNLLKIVPTLQAVSVMDENLKLVNKKKKTSKDFIKTGVKNVIGIEFTKMSADLAGGFN